jgi:hypothetical protein
MTESYETQIDTALAALRAASRAIAAEIHSYPTPISGCDAQFNHLLAERRRLAEAMAALRRDVFVPTPRMPSPFSRVESR